MPRFLFMGCFYLFRRLLGSGLDCSSNLSCCTTRMAQGADGMVIRRRPKVGVGDVWPGRPAHQVIPQHRDVLGVGNAMLTASLGVLRAVGIGLGTHLSMARP
jgi:hypothetical protein